MKILFVLFTLIFLTSCDKLAGCQEEETFRTKSFDYQVDVVLMVKKCSLTKTIQHVVYLESNGYGKDREAVYVLDKKDGFKVYWKGEKHVIVEPGEAKVHSFQDKWIAEKPINKGYEVKITEIR